MLKTCPTCTYAYEGDSCTNPACFANPSVTDEQKRAWTERNERLAAEEAERERIRQIRRRFR